LRDIVCISHLRWDFVWQRPQHILSRLAASGYRIFFVEEPVTDAAAGLSEPVLRTFPGAHAPNVTVVRLVQPSTHDYWLGHGDERTQAEYSRQLQNFLGEAGATDPIFWMYTPMGADFPAQIPHAKLIYDVMDQLSAFKGAPPNLLEQERALLRRADIVFTGGVSLYRDKLPFNPNTHLFPSGVDVAHFAQAADRDNFERPADLPPASGAPLLGYYGVIDERLDLELLAHLAEYADWQIAMLGPVVKIDPADLPQAPNLVYPGMKNYEQLPLYLAHFDVCLIPFAMNEATRYLSPTKTLEYMAAHKPIVSYPIPDVVELFSQVVHIANTPAEFATQVKKALATDPATRKATEDDLLATYTWDSIVARMSTIIGN
jgi:UDP-galactopyranose mutase